MGRIETITLGGGCFWCTQAVFSRLKGVVRATPGYSGGTIDNPSYDQVSAGKTGHVEVVQVEYDSEVLPFRKILEIFFFTHDPTTLNRQGADVGSQYASVIFYQLDEQRREAEAYIKELSKKKVYNTTIVTRLEPFKTFYPAEDYHIDYYKTKPSQPYSRYVIAPKIEKLEKKFSETLKVD